MRELLKSYQKNASLAAQLRRDLEPQLLGLMNEHSLSIVSPIESRTKEWRKILNKVDRHNLALASVTDLWDFVGFRLVFLLTSEAERASEIVRQAFREVRILNKGQDLSTTEFGYQSIHCIARLRESWLEVPPWKNYSSFQMEIQIRSLSQNTWGVASRTLQYNQAAAVPIPMRRSLHRLAALLELVDVELERISREREEYVAQLSQAMESKALFNMPPGLLLNVDLLANLLDRILPAQYKTGGDSDNYSELFSDLQKLAVSGTANLLTVKTLLSFVLDHLEEALDANESVIQQIRSGDTAYSGVEGKIKQGVFYSHVGLVQNMLNQEFGNNWRRGPEDAGPRE